MNRADVHKLVAQLGGPAALARRLKITSQAVSQWTRVPYKHTRRICALAARQGVLWRGQRITPRDLHPTLF